MALESSFQSIAVGVTEAFKRHGGSCDIACLWKVERSRSCSVHDTMSWGDVDLSEPLIDSI